MQDVEVPARVEAVGGRSARPAGSAGLRANRSVVVAAAFVVAVLLGVAIGYVTADRGSSSAKSGPDTAAVAPELTPTMRPAPWEGSRVPGTPHQVNVQDELDPVVLRLALSYAVAEQIKGSGAAAAIARQVTVEQGLYFGAVEGTDAAHDQFWAVGRIQGQGVANLPPDPLVWRRIGTGPWTIVASGTSPNACNQIPQSLIQAWKGQPPPCAG